VKTFAAIAGISEADAANILTGAVACPTKSMIDAMAAAFGVDAEIFLAAGRRGGCQYEDATEEDADKSAATPCCTKDNGQCTCPDASAGLKSVRSAIDELSQLFSSGVA